VSSVCFELLAVIYISLICFFTSILWPYFRINFTAHISVYGLGTLSWSCLHVWLCF